MLGNVAMIIIPFVLASPLIIFVFTWLIPEMKNDKKWYRYEEAYSEWERKGKIGKMPRAEDYGWEPPSKRKG